MKECSLNRQRTHRGRGAVEHANMARADGEEANEQGEGGRHEAEGGDGEAAAADGEMAHAAQASQQQSPGSTTGAGARASRACVGNRDRCEQFVGAVDEVEVGDEQQEEDEQRAAATGRLRRD